MLNLHGYQVGSVLVLAVTKASILVLDLESWMTTSLMWYHKSYLPCWNILPELLIDNATNGHEVGVAGHLWSVVHPQVVFKILAER